MSFANTIVDLSHRETDRDPSVDFEVVKRDGIQAVFHKATQGLKNVDAMYGPVEEAVRAAGLLFGAYHFGSGDDPLAQVDHFLAVVRPRSGTLLALDFEPNPNGADMTLPQAEAFVREIFRRTGRWPGLYAGRYLSDLLAAGDPGDIGGLLRCWLWLSRYNASLSEPPVPAPFSAWHLWQYTDGKDGAEPRAVRGVGPCDRSVFQGSEEELRRFWLDNAW